VFYSNGDYVTLSFHAEALYKEFVHNLESIPLDVAGMMTMAQQPLLGAAFNRKQTIDFSLEVMSTSLNLKRRGCLERATRKGVHFQCDLWCRVESIVAACDCVPLARQFLPEFAELPRTLPNCACGGWNFESEKCRNVLASQYDSTNCSQACYGQNCEIFLFEQSTTPGDVSMLDQINATTVVRLTMNKFIFLKVDEYLTMDLKALVAALGGNLNLYLGASFLASIHIIVFCVKLPSQLACRGRKEQSNRVNNRPLTDADLSTTKIELAGDRQGSVKVTDL